ncbi:MAG: cytochrome C oxidase subunit IV family protein [Candidatus Solibacter usitatus]|nr:cytochrome C oxidase subunit IV family protein [Candidatus Solibacter usitatus]
MDQHQEHHVAPSSMYYAIFAILICCTGLTYFVWTIDLGFLNIVVALSIAIFKATLVIRYFMHVKWSPILSKMAVATSLVFLGILLVLLSMDYASRGWQPKSTGWEKHQVTQ